MNRRSRIALLAISTVLVAVSVAAVSASAASLNDVAAPVGDDTYKVLDRGVPIQCHPSHDPSVSDACAINMKVAFSSRETVRYLGLKSGTLASGVPAGPVTATFDGRQERDVYFLKIPAALVRKIKAKHVVAMSVAVTGTATYKVQTGGGEGGPPPSLEDYSQKLDFTGSNEDGFGQGRRYGCFPVGPVGESGNELIIGYLRSGQKCPKHP